MLQRVGARTGLCSLLHRRPEADDGVVKQQPGNGPSDRHGIVVGVDGSPESLHALHWAETCVGRFGPLRPVSAWQYPWWMVPNPLPGAPIPPPATQFQAETEERVQQILSAAGVRHHAKPVVSHGGAGPILVTNGVNANMIAVGTRGRGAVADTLLGSVSRHVISHATVPVAVIPTEAEIIERPRRVLVGIDGSDNSTAALVWAIENTPEEVPIEAVHVWHYVLSALPEEGPIPTDTFEAAAQELLDRVVVEAILEAEGSRRDIIQRLEFGDPRNTLRELSEQADLLVVGAQGHRGVGHLIVGSITTGLTHQPRAATVIVPSIDQ